MKNKIFIIIFFSGCFLVLLNNCQKNSSSPEYDKRTTIRAYLNEDDIITAYEYLDSLGNIISSTQISYLENSFITIKDDTTINKYILDGNNRIIYALDSSLTVCDTIFRASYNGDGYLDYLDYYAISYGYINYHYEDSCTSFFIPSTSFTVYLSDYENFIDFIGNPDDQYLNFIHLGRQNQKLVSEIEWGGSGGPSINAPRSEYEYRFNKNNYIVEKIEHYYPLHVGSLTDDQIIHYLTTIAYYRL